MDNLVLNSTVTAVPINKHGRDIFDKREHALLGLSMGHSYFTEESIGRFTQWAVVEFQSMHLVVWEQPYVWSLQALGVPEVKARRKAHKDAMGMMNKAARALASAGFDTPESRIITWSKACEVPAYLELLNVVHEAFDSDMAFRDACLDCSRKFLEKKELLGNYTYNERLHISVRYVLSEMPFFIDTPSILNVPSSAECYPAHPRDNFHNRLHNGEFSLKPTAGQTHVTLKVLW